MSQAPEIEIPDAHKKMLAENNNGLISTIRHKDGLISTNPVSYVFDGECVRVSTIKSRIKYDNLKANPMVTFCVIHHADHTKYVELRGYASIEEDPDREFLRRQFRETSGGEEAPADLDPPDSDRVIVRIHPQQSSSPLLYGAIQSIALGGGLFRFIETASKGTSMSDADDRFAIIETLDRYSECLDLREWERLSDVFTADVDMDFGDWHKQGRETVVGVIRSYLDGCGPSQHLLGNYRIVLDGDRASSRCYCRVMHMGKGAHEGKTYEAWIEYSDELIRTSSGWRSEKRVGHTQMQQGDPFLYWGRPKRARTPSGET